MINYTDILKHTGVFLLVQTIPKWLSLSFAVLIPNPVNDALLLLSPWSHTYCPPCGFSWVWLLSGVIVTFLWVLWGTFSLVWGLTALLFTEGIPDSMLLICASLRKKASGTCRAILLLWPSCYWWVATAIQCNTSSRTSASLHLCGACSHLFMQKYLRSISHRPEAV